MNEKDVDLVETGYALKDLLHRELVLGQTRHVCRYGTLSDGHEKLTDAQKYYQAIKECWFIACSIKDRQADLMQAEADCIDAKAELDVAVSESARLRAKAKLMRAELRCAEYSVSIEDQLRMLDEYNTIRLELKDAVQNKYPLGIEQAEPDNWQAVFEYRMLKSPQAGAPGEHVQNIPLEPKHKAMLGLKHQRLDAVAPLAMISPEEVDKLVTQVGLLK